MFHIFIGHFRAPKDPVDPTVSLDLMDNKVSLEIEDPLESQAHQ